MKVLIIGSAGMIGNKLLGYFARNPELGGQSISEVVAFDVIKTPPRNETDIPIAVETGDLSAPECASKLLSGSPESRPDIIFDLAAVVSGEAEADFEKGYRINLDGTRLLLEAIRAVDGYCPRVVFTSSIAVFGAPFPEPIPADFFSTPLTSYGTQKAICELLLADYTRRGFVDGIGVRLPTICVRPGKPNLAASGFFSNIIREPLVGKPAVLPVADDVRHWFASPRSAVHYLLHAAELNQSDVGPRCNLTMPGISVTVEEQIEALRSVAGQTAVDLIRREPDETIAKIVEGWPRSFDDSRARDLGFACEQSFEEIIRIHVDDELS